MKVHFVTLSVCMTFTGDLVAQVIGLKGKRW